MKELTDHRLGSIDEISKDDQLVLLSEHLVKNFNPQQIGMPNPEENDEVARLLLKRQQQTSYQDIFGNPTLTPPPPVKDELL